LPKSPVLFEKIDWLVLECIKTPGTREKERERASESERERARKSERERERDSFVKVGRCVLEWGKTALNIRIYTCINPRSVTHLL